MGDWRAELVPETSRGYMRDACISQEVAYLRQMSEVQFWQQVNATAARKAGAPQPVTLVTIARMMLRCGQENEARELASAVSRHAAHHVARMFRGSTPYERQLREDVRNDVMSQVVVCVLDLTPGSEFWEANFIGALRSLISTARRNAWRRNNKERLLEPAADDGAGDEMSRLPDTRSASVEDQVSLKLALEALRSPVRYTVVLRFRGYTECEIGDMLGVSDRTVRNYLTEARAALSASV